MSNPVVPSVPLSVEQERLSSPLHRYITELAAHHAFAADVIVDQREVLPRLLRFWPKLAGYESETQELLAYINDLVGAFPVQETTPYFLLRIAVSQNQLVPLIIPEATETASIAMMDSATGIMHRCLVRRAEKIPDLSFMEIQAGIMILCQPVPPLINQFHDTVLLEDRALVNLYAERYQDQLLSGDQSFMPSFPNSMILTIYALEELKDKAFERTRAAIGVARRQQEARELSTEATVAATAVGVKEAKASPQTQIPLQRGAAEKTAATPPSHVEAKEKPATKITSPLAVQEKAPTVEKIAVPFVAAALAAEHRVPSVEIPKGASVAAMVAAQTASTHPVAAHPIEVKSEQAHIVAHREAVVVPTAHASEIPIERTTFVTHREGGAVPEVHTAAVITHDVTAHAPEVRAEHTLVAHHEGRAASPLAQSAQPVSVSAAQVTSARIPAVNPEVKIEQTTFVAHREGAPANVPRVPEAARVAEVVRATSQPLQAEVRRETAPYRTAEYKAAEIPASHIPVATPASVPIETKSAAPIQHMAKEMLVEIAIEAIRETAPQGHHTVPPRVEPAKPVDLDQQFHKEARQETVHVVPTVETKPAEEAPHGVDDILAAAVSHVLHKMEHDDTPHNYDDLKKTEPAAEKYEAKQGVEAAPQAKPAPEETAPVRHNLPHHVVIDELDDEL